MSYFFIQLDKGNVNLHLNVFYRALAIEAEDNMEATQPPLFLQFCNLLINDAIYLLDEGLSYMSKLREQQSERTDLGTWPDVPPAQRSQREATYQHMGLLARFHNMMGKETIRILEMMTREIKSVLVHSTMVDRIAAMLNYFLLHLVNIFFRYFHHSRLSWLTHFCRFRLGPRSATLK